VGDEAGDVVTASVTVDPAMIDVVGMFKSGISRLM
jgi:hypothetical protein